MELPKNPTEEELSALDRWFAVRLNNQVWDVLDAATVTADSAALDRDQLMYAAQAATYHWYQAGDAANHARAEYLMARVAVVTGNAADALRHAQRSLDLCRDNEDLVADWDVAMAHEALARAQAANVMTTEASETLATARSLASEIGDPQDRQLVEGELRREPWFGLIPS